jgi:hypothetical protein
MADGRDPAPAYRAPAGGRWTEVFRTFQIALDPRKLVIAAAAILVMSFGWFVLSYMFWYQAPNPNADDYSVATMQRVVGERPNPKTNQPWTPEDLAAEGRRRFDVDFARWGKLDQLAGDGGRLRTLPWYEYRGPNPYIFVTNFLGGTSHERSAAIREFATGSVPVLVEPLVKFLLPIAKLVSPGVSPLTRFYLFLCILWMLAVWGFAGGVITRIAAVQYANKGSITFRQAFRFTCVRYVNFLLSPLIPLGIIAAVLVGLFFYGLIALIPIVGDVFLLGLGLPLVIAAGAVMAVFLVGLVGYPLMYPTLSTEGDSSDTFDALSRSINYVYQSPWQYIWYWLVAVLYGAACTLFVFFFCSLMVYVGKWGVGLAASAIYSDRKPDFLFVYAPQSFGWRELLTADSPFAVTHVVQEARDGHGRMIDTYAPVPPVNNPEAEQRARNDMYVWNKWGAGIAAFWLVALFLMMLGFSYSFFWSAATIVYFLMRRRVDEADLDEVFLEEDEPEAPLAPPKLADGTTAPASTSLPVLGSAPAATSPPPPTTLPFGGPTASDVPPPKPTDEHRPGDGEKPLP